MASSNRPDGEVTVKDPEEYNRLRRLRAIHDARESVIKTRSNTFERMAEEHLYMNEQKAKVAFRRALDAYIMELEPLMRRADGGQKYLEEVALGKQVAPGPDGEYLEFVGLESLLDSGEVLEFTWTEESICNVNGKIENEHSEKVVVEPPILKRAFRMCNEFCAECGLDVAIEQAVEEGEIPYPEVEGLDV